MNIKNFIGLDKLALILSLAAFMFIITSSQTDCVHAAAGSCLVGDDEVFAGNIGIKGGTTKTATLTYSGAADITVDLPHGTGVLATGIDISQAVDDLSGVTDQATSRTNLGLGDVSTVDTSTASTSGEVLTYNGSAAVWSAPAGGSNFGTTYAKLSAPNPASAGYFDFTSTDVDLGSNISTPVNTTYTVPSTGYYYVLFQQNQSTAVTGDYNVNVVKNGSTFYGCGNQTASHRFNCFQIVDAAATDTLTFYYWSSVGAMASNYDATVYIYRID